MVALAHSHHRKHDRTNAGCSTGAANQLLSDGTYNYELDAEGNRIKRTKIVGGNVTVYGVASGTA
jgi:hypothetical protein